MSPDADNNPPGASQPEEAAPAGGQDEPDVAATPPAGAEPATPGGPLLDSSEVAAMLADLDRERPLDSADPDAALISDKDEDGAPMDQVISEAGSPGDAADIDALIAGALSGEDDVRLDQPAGEPPSSPPAPTTVRAEAPSGAAVPDLVSSENLAAAVPAEENAALEELAREVAQAPPSVPEIESVPPEAPKPSGKWRFRPPTTPAFSPAVARAIRRNLPKLLVSLTAGALFGVSTFVFLATHPTRTPDTAGELARKYDLRQGVEDARNLVDLGRYPEALQELDALIAQAPEGAERADAQFLRIQATYKTLPERVPAARAAALRAEIDAFVRDAPSHPEVAEAFRIKGNLYDREDDPYAARGAYNRILTEFGNASNLDQVLLDVGKTSMQLKRYDEAAAQFRRLVDQFPASPLVGQGKLLLADAYVAGGQRDAGRDLYRQISASQPGTRLGAQAYVRLGEMAFNEGRYDEAIKLLEDRLAAATTVEGNDEVFLFLAKAYRDTGHLDKADRILRELLDFFPDSPVTPEALVTLSMVLDKEGMRPEAVSLAMQAAQRYPDNAEVLRTYAQLMAASGEPARAAQALVDADAAGAGDPRLLLEAGRKFRQANQPDQARQALDRLMGEFPASPAAVEAAIELGQVAYGEGKIGKALQRLEDLELVSQGKPGRVPALLALGKMRLDVGLEDQAGQAFDAVTALSADPRYLAQAAVGLLDVGATDRGLEVANRVDPGVLPDAEAYALLVKHGEALLRVNSDAAIAKLEKAYDSFPAQRTAQGDETLLNAYLVTDQSAKARALVMGLDTLARQDPLQASRLQRGAILWGDHLYDKGDYQAAGEAYQLAANVATGSNADVEWARFQAANALFEGGDYENSAPLLEKAAAAKSAWSDIAKTRAEYARAELRMRGSASSTEKTAEPEPAPPPASPLAPAEPAAAPAAPAAPPAPLPGLKPT